MLYSVFPLGGGCVILPHCVCNRGATFVARRAPIKGARPIPYASSNLTPQHLFGQGAFRCCSELSMTIWFAYIRLEQVYLGLLGQFDPTLHPQVRMALHMRCQIDHRGSPDASSRPYVHHQGSCLQGILKQYHPRSLDYRPRHGVLVTPL